MVTKPNRPKEVDPRLKVPLLSVAAVYLCCHECGCESPIEREHLETLDANGCSTFGDLGRLITCQPCKSAGSTGKNISLEARGAPIKNTSTRRSRELI